jgi:predicted acetyltransferase
MITIKSIPTEDFDRYLVIAANAFPGMKANTDEERKKLRERFDTRLNDPRVSHWGAYQKKNLVGGIRFFDFTLSLRGAKIPCGGGGFLAIDLLHKKEHVARDLVRYWLNHYRQHNTPMATLWAFRPDFYKKMGFGFGAKLDRYSVKPADLPSDGNKNNVRFLTRADIPAIHDCYNKYVGQTTGMFEETIFGWESIYDANQKWRFAGYEIDGKLLGYMVFEFEQIQPDNFLNNNIKILRLVYETPEALRGLLTFLHCQSDQIDRVIIHTNDEYFYYLLKDVRNGTGNLYELYHESHISGVGTMYRVIDLPALFKQAKQATFGNESCTIKISLSDSFLPDHDTSVVVKFSDGRATLVDKKRADVEINLDVSDFSSMLLGAVKFKALHQYGLATISDINLLDKVNNIFATDSRPFCQTQF